MSLLKFKKTMKTKLYLIIAILSPFILNGQLSEFEGDVDVNNGLIQLEDPVDAQDVATKFSIQQKTEERLNSGLYGTLRDIDDNVYRTIKIGEQVWMADNLNVTRYNDGSPIPRATDFTSFLSLFTPAYMHYDGDSLVYAEQCGALYNYFAVADTNSLSVCPVDWHVPTSAEWEQLISFLIDSGFGFGGSGDDIAKSVASDNLWISLSFPCPECPADELGTNNSSKLDLMPCGLINITGFVNFRGFTWIHSSDEPGTGNVYNYQVALNSEGFGATPNAPKNNGMSIRCIRDD